MQEQHSAIERAAHKPQLVDIPVAKKEKQKFGIITVAAGAGLHKVFKDLRADVIINGGQTMNPSTQDFAKEIEKLNADHIIILPNNSNIIMAARQAADVTEGKDIHVLETRSIPQGLAACINFNPDTDAESNEAAMQEAISHVKTGQITYAIKDTSVDGREIHAGDYMGIFEKEICCTSQVQLDAAHELIRQMMDDEAEIVTLIKGADAADADTEELTSFIEENYDVDVDVVDGGQPVYSFIIGVE
jgi:dihydroxyacetone kinase-like predicted kinase